MAGILLPVYASDVAITPTSNENYVSETYVRYVPPRYRPTGNGQCVDFVQANGFAHLSGNANVWASYINSSTPSIGAVVVLNESYWGHVAIVVSFTNIEIKVVEQNYLGPYIVSYRTIPRSDVHIIGYIPL